MDGKSLNQRELQIQKLREAFPEVVSEQGVDWERLRATLGDDVTLSNERYVLNWAGKSEAFRAIQTPTTATLKPLPDQSVDFDTTKNIFIEGENLEVLKILQKSYYGKVKMIYIDPPYNTGSDSFIYPDKFSESKEEYLKRIGDKDEEGYLTKEGLFRKNSRENGQFHSNWLSMMYPRLFLARNLLRDDGVIFVSIDDEELSNLRLIMNEVFGEECFIAQLVWKSRQFPDARAVTKVSTDHEYMLVYSKFSSARLKGIQRDETKFSNPDRDPRGPWMSRSILGLASKKDRPNLHFEITDPSTGWTFKPPANTGWRYSKARMDALIRENRIIFPARIDGRPRERKYRSDLTSERISFPSIIDDIFTADGTAEIREIFGKDVFDFPKPTKLLKELVLQATEDGDTILDFFAGIGSLGHAVFLLNIADADHRNFVLVQLAEKTKEDSEACKDGFKTISSLCVERLRRASKARKTEIEEKKDLFKEKTADFGFRSFMVESSNFKIWRTDTVETEEELRNQLEAFGDPVRSRFQADNMAWEILLKLGYDLTTPMQREDLGGMLIYNVNEHETILILEAANQTGVDAVVALKPKRVICLDRFFAGNDQMKTNTALQMKDAGIEFRTI